jgi:uncharacterized protein involved in exopolysaccharide biosynthesis
MDSEHLTGSTVPPASPGDSRQPGRLVRALRRVLAGHWGKILVIWALVTGSLVFVIFSCFRPVYESVSILRSEPPIDLMRQPGAAKAWEPFLQTQVELIRSAPVLRAALTKHEVAVTRLVREAKDPESAIRSRLKVNVVPGTYLIEMRLRSSDPEDGPAIVNAVVGQYVSTAGGATKIKPIDRARPGIFLGDARWKLATMTPVGVLAVVLCLPLVAELRSGGVSGRHEKPHRAADNAGAPTAES